METVCIEIGDARLEVCKGVLLADALRDNGFAVDMPCGGTGKCGKCRVQLAGTGAVLACKYRVEKDIRILSDLRAGTIFTPENEQPQNIPAGKADLAIDLGTTTVALALVEPETRKILYKKACNNPQRAFGADVISRIAFCAAHGAGPLQTVLLQGLQEALAPLQAAGTQIENLYVSGNTTMLHLFLGADCAALGTAPYTPQFLSAQPIPVKSFGLPGKRGTTLPCLSAFVGADVLAGLLTCAVPQAGRCNLLLDLGTNAEIVLFEKDRVLCTSAAAGPCFEGANISCGMPATDGAVTQYSYSYGPTFLGRKPVGICGTGLVDVVSELLLHGVIDETGAMEAEAFAVAPGVSVTAEDIRQFQLAKAAVRAGTQRLLAAAGISEDEVETVYLAGGFSAYLNSSSACKTGLIHPKLRKKCVWLGNASLSGCAVYEKETARARHLTAAAQYIDLAADGGFAEQFMRYMRFGE